MPTYMHIIILLAKLESSNLWRNNRCDKSFINLELLQRTNKAK